jgi:hypothetical protein
MESPLGQGLSPAPLRRFPDRVFWGRAELPAKGGCLAGVKIAGDDIRIEAGMSDIAGRERLQVPREQVIRIAEKGRGIVPAALAAQ